MSHKTKSRVNTAIGIMLEGFTLQLEIQKEGPVWAISGRGPEMDKIYRACRKAGIDMVGDCRFGTPNYFEFPGHQARKVMAIVDNLLVPEHWHDSAYAQSRYQYVTDRIGRSWKGVVQHHMLYR